MHTRSRAVDFMDANLETTQSTFTPPPRHKKGQSIAEKYALSTKHHEAAKRISSTFQATDDQRKKFSCPTCQLYVSDGIECSSCLYWFHQKCATISDSDFTELSNSDEVWNCHNCKSPKEGNEQNSCANRYLKSAQHEIVQPSLPDFKTEDRISSGPNRGL